jgi:hypothetical protein
VTALGYSSIELRCAVPYQGRAYYAQANFNLYGREGSLENASSKDPPDWPLFELSSPEPLYWPQTGQTFFLKILNAGPDPGPLAVREAGREDPVAWVKVGEDGIYTYVPPLDPELDKRGPTATKDIVFVLDLPEGGTASFTLAIHRSREARRNFPAGLGVFSVSLVLGCGLVAAKRRRGTICH